MVGECETPAFLTAVGRAIDYLRQAIPVLEVHSGLPEGSLRLPVWADAARPPVHLLKEFCVGLLANPECHTWWPVLARVSLEHRTTIAGSLFLARKMLPVLPSPPDAHKERVCSRPAPPPPPGYLRFVRRIVRMELRKGWDVGYDRRVSSFCPPLSSSLQRTRASGGARSQWVGRRVDFLEASFGLRPFRCPSEFRTRFMNVELDGKSRSVTVASATQHLLGPLHRCLYDAVSRRPWLLRGEAKKTKFTDFFSVEGEVFVSGDYESATDNLSLEVAEVILDELRVLSDEIPSSIWDFARLSLRAVIEYPDGTTAHQVRGQLMGNLLSFPLLCLQNYIAFRWCVGSSWRKIPVRINGDDIVFRAGREVADGWMDTVSALGLKLCRGKTLVSKSIFSLNSTFFRATRLSVLSVPVLRSSVLGRDVSVPHGLGPGLRTFRAGFVGEARVRAECIYLRWRDKQFSACGRSVLRDLHAPVDPESLVRVGWGRREAFYLDCPPCPLPLDQLRLGRPSLPEGWSRVPVSNHRGQRRRQRCAQESFFGLLSDQAWNLPPVSSRSLQRGTWRETMMGSLLSSWRWWRTRSRRWEKLRGEFRLVAKRFRCRLSLLWQYDEGRRVKKVWAGGRCDRPGLGFS